MAEGASNDTLMWNFKLLAHNALDGFGGMGEGMSMQLAKDGRRILWLAHESAPKNFTAVDVTDPRQLKIVARADLLKALVKALAETAAGPVSDAELYKKLVMEMASHGWLPRANFGASVENGVVTYFGTIQDERERTALRVIAENTAGVRGICDKLVCIEPMSGVVIDRPA